MTRPPWTSPVRPRRRGQWPRRPPRAGVPRRRRHRPSSVPTAPTSPHWRSSRRTAPAIVALDAPHGRRCPSPQPIPPAMSPIIPCSSRWSPRPSMPTVAGGETAAIAPTVVVLMGSSTAKAVLGSPFKVTRQTTRSPRPTGTADRDGAPGGRSCMCPTSTARSPTTTSSRFSPPSPAVPLCRRAWAGLFRHGSHGPPSCCGCGARAGRVRRRA